MKFNWYLLWLSIGVFSGLTFEYMFLNGNINWQQFNTIEWIFQIIYIILIISFSIYMAYKTE